MKPTLKRLALISMTMCAGAAVAEAKVMPPPPPATRPASPVPGPGPMPAQDGAGALAPLMMRPVQSEPRPPAPRPAAELIAFAGLVNGTWKCKGTLVMPDGSSMPMIATIRNKLDLGSFWMRQTFTASGQRPWRFEAFLGFEGGNHLWRRVMVDSLGGSMASTAPFVPGKFEWDGTAHGPMGEMSVRDHDDYTNPRAARMWGEWSIDKGQHWAKGYEVACKR